MKELIDTCFNITYEEMYPKVIAYVVAKCSDVHYVEDIVQEIFSEYYGLLCKKGISYVKNPEAIIIKIAKTKVYKYYSLKEKLKRAIPLTNRNKEEEESENYNIEYEDIEEQYVNRHTIDEIWQIISSTPAIVQKIFILHYYADKKIKEIAKELKISESNVKHKLYRTIEKVREKYKSWESEI